MDAKKIIAKNPWIALPLAALIFIGCANSSSSTTSSSNGQTQSQATIQQGQWEFDFQPPVYNPNFQPNTDAFMEVNLQVSGTQFSASVVDVTGYDPYFSPSAEHNYGAYFSYPFPNGYIKIMCENDTISGSISPSLTVNVGAGSDIANLTGTISGTNLTSFSGNWTANVGGHEPWQCEGDAVGSGTFTAKLIAPLNGTFMGLLQTSLGGSYQVTATITQNGFAVSGSGMATLVTGTGCSGCLNETLSFTGNVIGALIYGQVTTSDINGIRISPFGGHIYPDGKTVDIVIEDVNHIVEWGTLSHP